MNSVIKTILGHRSIRQFSDQGISSEQLQSIIDCGIAASTSSLLQAVSIIRVTEPEKRAKLAELAGPQPYVEQAAEFLVFCIDFHRHQQINPQSQLDFTELTLIGAVDAGIMAQNCLLAAESMGLGGVYIGGLRNAPAEVDALLDLPQHCAILFGMCLGHPAQDPELKPRLSPQAILHENRYQPERQSWVSEYDERLSDYYQQRSANAKQEKWSEQIGAKLNHESRPYIKDYLASKNLAKR
ncbi:MULTISPECIES: oxygen-insensitive NADPH nitroreductase [unclassified Vibrio]|uniref:Oxygen-insensitive NADPH nitroreductase n=1 Tax=Vibrio sp. HB236076 TaxID=3232307 RepID=A0AB39HI57_9VIBR|nr:oxygen-insensitive NADPH nitroreductase [Vibrio sp. HB161653]MDP5254936.1 oxygen-insensitive NADPH nitroreductase [Vibrio sp. HB161653]